MKIKILLLAFLFVSPVLAKAQVTVVRVQNQHVYLDTSTLKTPVNKGDTFKVILSSEKLTNPNTGKELGLLHNYSAQGIITEVQPLYAVGQLPSQTGVQVGQEAVIETAQPAAEVKAAVSPAKEAPAKHKKITYDPVEQEIISLSTADITAPGADNLVTADTKGRVSVWTRKGEKLEEALSYMLPTGKRPVTLSALPVRGQKTAEIFVTVYDEHLSRIFTLVLADENGHLAELAQLPYFVKELGCGAQKTLWMQRPFVTGIYPGNAHAVVYRNGEFTHQSSMLNTQRNWLTGLNIFAKDTPQLIFTTSTGRVKLQMPNGKFTQYKDFSVGAPNRVKYKQEIVKFYPSLQVVESQGQTQAVAVENTAKFGLLSNTFGQYESGKIHFLALEKGRLTSTDTVTLDGFVYDTACSDAAVLAAEVLPDGQSSIVEILK